MRVDLDQRRVFLPGEGWLDETAFWHLYFHEPQRLPGDLDFEALDRLGYPRTGPSPESEKPS